MTGLFSESRQIFLVIYISKYMRTGLYMSNLCYYTVDLSKGFYLKPQELILLSEGCSATHTHLNIKLGLEKNEFMKGFRGNRQYSGRIGYSPECMEFYSLKHQAYSVMRKIKLLRVIYHPLMWNLFYYHLRIPAERVIWDCQLWV